MRIAYLAPYKGPSVVERRRLVKGLSLSNTIKIELIASLLQDTHDVEIISMGEVVHSHLAFYPGFKETKSFHPSIPVTYISSLPIRFVNGFWSSWKMLEHFRKRHSESPFDLVIIFNLKRPHIACANYARRLGIPVVFEYEDDSFVDVTGRTSGGLIETYHRRAAARILKNIDGGIGVSPYLLSQMPDSIPKLLMRGAVGADIVSFASSRSDDEKQNRVLFSGTHVASNGVAELIEAWAAEGPPDWELHITGQGQLTESLKQLAASTAGVVFHGLVSREQLVELLCSAKICINPHAVSDKPGNVFAFKIIEYLAAGAHVITTPMGVLEPELEAGMTYMSDNAPPTIASTLRQVIGDRRFERRAADAARRLYGTPSISRALNALLEQLVTPERRDARAVATA